ncbi:MAG: hypothetical protein R6V06_01760 [Kiritimatiellia bacterium]
MAKAKINREYLLRMCGVAAFMLAICVWSLYDGFVAWPERNEEFERVRSVLQATNLTARAWLAKTGENGMTPLDEIFAAEGLETPSKLVRMIDEYKMADNLPPDMADSERARERKALAQIFAHPLYSEEDLTEQVVMAFITVSVAGWILLLVLIRLRKVYIADENALYGSGFGGVHIEYDDIDSIDWKLWDKKGIVKLKFKNGKSCTLDAWHYNGIKDVVDAVIVQRPDLKRP